MHLKIGEMARAVSGRVKAFGPPHLLRSRSGYESYERLCGFLLLAGGNDTGSKQSKVLNRSRKGTYKIDTRCSYDLANLIEADFNITASDCFESFGALLKRYCLRFDCVSDTQSF